MESSFNYGYFLQIFALLIFQGYKIIIFKNALHTIYSSHNLLFK